MDDMEEVSEDDEAAELRTVQDEGIFDRLHLVNGKNAQVMRKRTVSKKFTAVTSTSLNHADTQCNLFHNPTHQKGVQVNMCGHCNATGKKSMQDSAVQTDLQTKERNVQTCNVSTTHDSNIARAVEMLQNSEFMDELLDTLGCEGQVNEFVNLLQCLRNGKLATDNIAWLCLLERAKYASCKTTTQMKYRRETVEFWNIIYLLFGNSALTVFRGRANFAQVATEQCRRGFYDPQQGNCNFSVPSIPTLRKVACGFERKIPPGFIQASLDMAQKKSAEGRQFTLCFDGKKVAEGCKNVADGDVDMMGLEKPRLRHRLKIYDQQMQYAEELQNLEDASDLAAHSAKLLRLITKLSKLLWHLQRSILCKAIGYNKLRKENEGNVRSEKRFQYTASFLNVKRHECEMNMHRVLQLIKRLVKLTAKCKGMSDCLCDTGFYDLIESPITFVLLPPEHVAQFVDFTKFTTEIKQRSHIWFQLRKRARLTGSTMYNALGLDQFNLQGEHYDSFIRGWPKVIDPVVQRKMAYGTANEINAVCTIVSVLIPCHFAPCTRFFETGMKFFGPPECPNMIEVSADGLIVCGMGEAACPYKDTHFGSGQKLAVEIKCCYPQDNLPHMPYDKIPKCYVTQCLAEMKALDCEAMIFACWTPVSTAVFLVHFDNELWERIYALSCVLYGAKDCKPQPKWHPESKAIAELLSPFIENKTHLLCILPSVRGCEGSLDSGDIPSAYRPCRQLNVQVPQNAEILEDTKCCATEAVQLFTDSHNALRNPAQEVMVWMLNDKDRLQEDKVPNSVPVCYHMKGRKFDIPMARKLVENVRNKLHEKHINILTEVYDGFFHPLIVKDIHGNPLTRLQLYKQSWTAACSMNKEHLISEMLKSSTLGVADVDILRVLRDLPAGEWKYTNLLLHKDVNPTRISIATLGGHSFPEGVAGQFKFAPLTEGDRNKWNEKVQGKKRRNPMVGLQASERNLLEAIHPELIDEISGFEEGEEDELMDLAEDELPDLILNQTPLQRLLGNNEFNLLRDLLAALREFNEEKWQGRTVDWLYPYMLSNAYNVDYYCIVPELQIIAKVLERYTVGRKWYDTNERKYFNVNLIATAFGSIVSVPEPDSRRKTFNPPSLLSMSKAAILRPSYPLVSLRVSYAKVLHKYRRAEWLRQATVPMSLPVPFRETDIQLFCYPEYSSTRNQVECRTFDPVHILTKVRGHLCRSGYKYAKKEAFHELANRRPDILSRSVVMDVIDPQNAFIAEKFFSQRVQDEIRAMGFEETADFLYLFHFFFRALNDRGMSADERCTWLYEMQKFLMQDVSLDTFPPQFNMNYINGMPIKTFEAILQVISNRFSLYGLAVDKTYNMRSSTTLPCESFFSDLTRSDREGHLYPKAANISRLMAKCVTLNYAKHNPSKVYDICTSNKSAYPVHLALDDKERYNRETSDDFDGIYRDHFFDYINEKSHHRVRRSDVSKGINPMRTVQGVRQWFRADESKINPANRVDFPVPIE